MSQMDPILCCNACYEAQTPGATKPHNDPNREIHHLIQTSFRQFCSRREHALAIHARVSGDAREPPPTAPLPGTHTLPKPQDLVPKLFLTPEALANNPIKKDSPYIIHMQSRINFGPVVAHRYFLCPLDLREDWVEISQIHFFAEGYPFSLKAMKWGVSCDEHVMFYQLTLRPNLNMRFHPEDVYGEQYLVPDLEMDGEQLSGHSSEGVGGNQYILPDGQTELDRCMALDQQKEYYGYTGLDPNTVIDEYAPPPYRGEYRQEMQFQEGVTHDYLGFEQKLAMGHYLPLPEVEYQQSTPFQTETTRQAEPNRRNLAAVLQEQLCEK